MSDDMDTIRKILEKIGISIPSIQYCLLMDRTGLLIASYGKYVFKEIDMDAVGALVGAVFQAGEEEGSAIEFKNLEIQINEYSEGFRFAVACEEVGVLSVISGKDVQIGLVRAAMKKYSPYLTKLMRKMFSTSGQEAMEDLKDLFSDFESFM